jgi:hypothetical protein
MIERKEEIVKAVCDACGASLLHDICPGEPILLRGILKNDFGFGAEPAALDPLGASVVANYDLCGACFVKACHAIGLPAHDGDLKEKHESPKR